ncbi:MAG: radical SAM/SPASM domain-containing protein [bacterium]|nr:radical SAM/SPASM domain-containing protein [bacterium]
MSKRKENTGKNMLRSLKKWVLKKTVFWSATLSGKVESPTLVRVAIEINSACNRKCAWCPNHKNHREDVYLEDALIYKVLDQLKEMGFKGKITFNHFNEPMMDKRLPTFIKYIREQIPAVHIYINTNGDYLTMESWKELREAGLDYAVISQYDGKINENVKNILEQLDAKEKKAFGAEVFSTKDMSNWAGLIKMKGNSKLPLQEICMKPFRQLQITYTGKAVLCCRDYFGKIEVGDIRTDSLKDIWASPVLKHYRKKLIKGDRGALKLCDVCI